MGQAKYSTANNPFARTKPVPTETCVLFFFVGVFVSVGVSVCCG